MPTCGDDGYPMVPIRDTGVGGITWGCTNPWHARAPEPCPECGYAGRPRSGMVGLTLMAICLACHHRWVPPGT